MDLPVIKKDYDFAVLVTDFISKIKKADSENGNIYEFSFKPQINGYDIVSEEFRIEIKRNKSDGIVVKRYNNGFSETSENYSSHSPQDNDFIIAELLNKQ